MYVYGNLSPKMLHIIAHIVFPIHLITLCNMRVY